MTTSTPTPLHCKVCAKPLTGQQRLYCDRPCKRRAYLVQRKLREAQTLADDVEKGVGYDPLVFDRRWVAEAAQVIVHKPQPPGIEVIREGYDPIEYTTLPLTTPPQPPLLRRCYAYIQLLAHTLYHIFDGWRVK